MGIKFERALRTEAKGITPQRLAAAKRAIQKDLDANALTPELVKPQNVDPVTRIKHADTRYTVVSDRLRDLSAKHWREGRHLFRTRLTPEMQAICLELWNRPIYPLTGTYFIGHVKRCIDRPDEVIEYWDFVNGRKPAFPPRKPKTMWRLTASKPERNLTVKEAFARTGVLDLEVETRFRTWELEAIDEDEVRGLWKMAQDAMIPEVLGFEIDAIENITPEPATAA
jgi:hypothetical protein